jgi:hypothetical protein
MKNKPRCEVGSSDDRLEGIDGVVTEEPEDEEDEEGEELLEEGASELDDGL